jgi:prepilin-type N-terminal cleavage/methylation domain-containing protein
MQKQIRKRTEGFTIIEVLIVLAIAGLILLIVFLAVPALQRNSRNTNRKNDVAALVGAAVEYSQNNNGEQPDTATGTVPEILISKSGGNPVVAKVGFYAASGISIKPGTTAANLQAVTSDTTVRLVTGAKCGTNGAAVLGAARGIAALYAVETGSGTATSVCQEG